jgi:hypothetical protein
LSGMQKDRRNLKIKQINERDPEIANAVKALW